VNFIHFFRFRVVELRHRLPQTLHPMTQLGIGVAALNHDSAFQAAYEKGIKKSEYWTYTLDDCISLIARLPALAARVYRNVYHPDNSIPELDKDLDLVGEDYNNSWVNELFGFLVIGNYSRLMGYGDNHNLTEYLRLYIALHGDHEGGNASAHAARMFMTYIFQTCKGSIHPAIFRPCRIDPF
jgi:citrate synthase